MNRFLVGLFVFAFLASGCNTSTEPESGSVGLEGKQLTYEVTEFDSRGVQTNQKNVTLDVPHWDITYQGREHAFSTGLAYTTPNQELYRLAETNGDLSVYEVPNGQTYEDEHFSPVSVHARWITFPFGSSTSTATVWDYDTTMVDQYHIVFRQRSRMKFRTLGEESSSVEGQSYSTVKANFVIDDSIFIPSSTWRNSYQHTDVNAWYSKELGMYVRTEATLADGSSETQRLISIR